MRRHFFGSITEGFGTADRPTARALLDAASKPPPHLVPA